MRSNATKKCAVAALLFGGTLSAVSTAQAGYVTWLDNDPTRPPPNGNGASFNYAGISSSNNFAPPPDYGPVAEMGQAWAATKTAGGASFMGMSVGWNATGDYGNFSVSMTNNPTVAGEDLWGQAQGIRWFKVTGTQQVSFSVAQSGSTSAAYFFLYGNGGNTMLFDSLAQGNSYTGTLNAGVYAIFYQLMIDIDATTYESVAGTASANFTVPVPGAAALVGLAGLMTRRRKA